MEKHPVVLGIDPGFASIGYCLMEIRPLGEHPLELGVIETKKSPKKRKVLACEDNFVRAGEICKALMVQVNLHDVRAVCAEAMSFPRNSSNAAKMALTWGVLAGICEYEAMPMVQPTPMQIKYRVAKKKTASKAEVQAALVSRYPSVLAKLDALPKTKREHAADALGAVVASLDGEVLRLVRRMQLR